VHHGVTSTTAGAARPFGTTDSVFSSADRVTVAGTSTQLVSSKTRAPASTSGTGRSNVRVMATSFTG
jgi:hypothetical protein